MVYHMTYITQQDFAIQQAIREIEGTFGDTVSVIQKKKSLIKFGRNSNVGTGISTVMELQGSELHETFVSTNSIDRIVSDDATFTGEITVEGHTIDGSNNLTFVTQTVTMTGQTAVTLTTPLARANRVSYASGNTPLATGKSIYVYENDTLTGGVPDTDSKVHVSMSAEFGQSQKCATAISSQDYWIITLAYGGALRKTAAIVNLRMEIRAIGGNWRTIFEIASQNGEHFDIQAPPAYIIPKNTDIRMVATSSASGTEVVAGLAGYLAVVV